MILPTRPSGSELAIAATAGRKRMMRTASVGAVVSTLAIPPAAARGTMATRAASVTRQLRTRLWGPEMGATRATRRDRVTVTGDAPGGARASDGERRSPAGSRDVSVTATPDTERRLLC